MTTAHFNEAWTADLRGIAWTDPGLESGLTPGTTGTADPEDRRREIVDLLLAWRSDPNQLRADEMEPPSADLIDAALRILHGWRSVGPPPPDRVVPNAEGGLAFEWYPDPWFFDLELFADGSAEWSISKDVRLVARESMRWRPA